MSRTFILVFGFICWTGVAINAAVHVALGDWLFPVTMAIFFVAWIALFQRHFARRAARA